MRRKSRRFTDPSEQRQPFNPGVSATALAQDSNANDLEFVKRRSTLFEAQALALLGLGQSAAADAAFTKVLNAPQSADYKAKRRAWFAQVKSDQRLLIAKHKK